MIAVNKMKLKGISPENFWPVRTIRGVVHYVRIQPPGSLLFLLIIVWLYPALIFGIALTLYVFFIEKFEITGEIKYFIKNIGYILIFLVFSGLLRFCLNLAERFFKFWDKIGELGQFGVIIIPYSSLCLLVNKMVHEDFIWAGYGSGIGDALTDLFIYPTIILYFILGFFIACLRIFIDILKSRNL